MTDSEAGRRATVAPTTMAWVTITRGAMAIGQIVATAGLDAECRPAVGIPAERLAEIADEVDAELIVVGSRGRGAFRAAFLGSLSNALVGVARCPVLIVPPGATETQ